MRVHLCCLIMIGGAAGAMDCERFVGDPAEAWTEDFICAFKASLVLNIREHGLQHRSARWSVLRLCRARAEPVRNVRLHTVQFNPLVFVCFTDIMDVLEDIDLLELLACAYG